MTPSRHKGDQTRAKDPERDPKRGAPQGRWRRNNRLTLPSEWTRGENWRSPSSPCSNPRGQQQRAHRPHRDPLSRSRSGYGHRGSPRAHHPSQDPTGPEDPSPTRPSRHQSPTGIPDPSPAPHQAPNQPQPSPLPDGLPLLQTPTPNGK
ncbi:basic salivary proline-rich protein 1 [Austrofundulus limnaeus]|uniref:Basic salivary proline-rich protein 1 n=1 Tax=Austrofundulus limnaeus TaxID=52670 RepID=A0A2I4AHM6_AUSLI|nr:PREDICTED: basic salivary proline-rich protein 1-like [Austrofundulus limnaeus]